MDVGYGVFIGVSFDIEFVFCNVRGVKVIDSWSFVRDFWIVGFEVCVCWCLLWIVSKFFFCVFGCLGSL